MKKIALFLGRDITANLICNRLIPQMIKMGFQPVLYITPYKQKKVEQGALSLLQDISFYETVLPEAVLYPYIDSTVKQNGTYHSFQALSDIYGVEYHMLAQANDPEFIKILRKDLDLCGGISIRCLQIYKADIISVMQEKGFFWNLHPGILPDYKGLYAPLRAREYGAQEYGYTLHHIDAGIDTGDIITVQRKKLDYSHSAIQLLMELAPLGAQAILDNLTNLSRNKAVTRVKQPKNTGMYFSAPDARELTMWEMLGIRAIHPMQMIEFLIKHYSVPGSAHASTLKANLMRAISIYERSKVTDSEPDFIDRRKSPRAA